jgi:hypothetical protein
MFKLYLADHIKADPISNFNGLSLKNYYEEIYSFFSFIYKEFKNDKKKMDKKIKMDSYTKEILKEQYYLHKSYVLGRINFTKETGVRIRLPSIPEDVSENIIKFIIHTKLDDKSSNWGCDSGDLYSKIEGKQECKCFTSDGPSSFTPISDWDVIYFLDAREWLNGDKFTLYRVPLKRTSIEWKNIKVSKTQTFDNQVMQGRRPRITWNELYPQIKSFCNKVFEGSFEDIFSTVAPFPNAKDK